MIILDDKIVHLIAGGAGGTAGAIVTCPLEVVKTRLQSSVATFETPTPVVHHASASHSVRHQLVGYNWCTCGVSTSTNPLSRQRPQPGIIGCLRFIIVNEGPRALFKGLGPNLVGVAPSRAIYFSAYSNTKNFLNGVVTPDTPLVHMGSACSAGFISCTATNPIWFVKTRLQLDQSKGAKKYGLRSCLKDIYHEGGIRAFYKGISASYYGISETVIHFVIYEYVKRKLREARGGCSCDQKTPRDFLEFMLSGAISKTCASVIAYPHEVARTRLRQEGGKYRQFWQTLYTVFREEGWRAMYRGLATQLVRQIPNTAIMMATYESVVYLLSSHEAYDDDDDDDD